MKVAVISDIHSNHIALEACILSLERESIDGIIFLGDYVSDCPDPQRTLSLMRSLMDRYQSWMIKGNREEYFIRHADGAKDDWSYSSYNGSLLYTYERLHAEDIQLFRDLPTTMLVEIPGTESITIAHGSPYSTRELLYEEAESTRHYLSTIQTNYLLCGHTHKQCLYQYNDKILLNPGSIGVAIGGHAIAQFAMIEWKNGRWNPKLQSVPYNYAALKEAFRQSELMQKAKIWPRCILKSIECGINMGPLCAKMAYDLAVEHNEIIENRIVPEKYWERAAKHLGII